MPKVKTRVSSASNARKNKEKVIHPGSRKAAQMMKETHRLEKKERRKAEKDGIMKIQTAKLMWFRERLDKTKTLYSCSDMCDLIERYLERHNEELEELQSLQVGRKKCMAESHRLQHASREDALRHVVASETQLYRSSGFEAPDLTNAKLFETFREWNGEENFIPKIMLRKYVYKPPRELSETDTTAP